MGVDRACVAEIVIIPHIVQDLLAGKGHALILRKIGKKLEFLVAEFDGCAVDSHLMGGFVDPDTAYLQGVRGRRAAAAQDGLDAGDQNLGTEGLGNVFVNAEIKTLKLVALFAAGGKHDDGDFGMLADGLNDLPAVHLRHHNIQDQKGNILLREKNIYGFFAVTGLSMGGRCTWKLALAMPDTFAAIVVCCGRSNTYEFDTIADMPIWMFHGAGDTTTSFDNINLIIPELIANNHRYFKLTVFAQGSHEIWDTVYYRPVIYDWLLSQSLEANRAEA